MIEYIPKGVFRFGQDDFVFEKDKKIVQGQTKRFQAGLGANLVTRSLIDQDAMLFRDEDRKKTIGIGMVAEAKETENSIVRIETLSDLSWARTADKELEGKGWRMRWFASNGLDHAFELKQTKKESVGSKSLVAIVQNSSSETPQISLVRERAGLPQFAMDALLTSKTTDESNDVYLEFVDGGTQKNYCVKSLSQEYL